MHSPEHASWRNPKVLATLVLVFVAGALTGAAGMRWGLHRRLHSDTVVTWRDPRAAKAFLDQCRKELNLTEQQAGEIQAVLDDYKQYYQSLDDIRVTGKTRIMEVLNKDQKAKLERMLGGER